jgi:hypothetical protein
MAEAGPGSAGGYVAFISYSHKDAALGRWLHHKLEGYRLPKRLAGTEGEDGLVPDRLIPIFRDRDELPAAGDLSERVRAALTASRNLIVICSPHSAASPWVAKEIATFRELHPGRPIFTAIVEGEPEQCFPPALREGGLEPLAADLRKGGDGKRLGLLKLVAGLAGVGLDTLVQRDAQRRVRRITYVTAAAVAAMLVMALLTAIALNARAEAQRQRAEAEGLVEFMLTDLRRELSKVGRLDVMAAVNERALSFYAAQERSDPKSASVVRARVDQTIGEDLLTRGYADQALRRFQAAHTLTSGLMRQGSNNPKTIFAHAQSEYWIGRIYELRREWPEAEGQYKRFSQLTDKLQATDPSNPEYMSQVAWAAVDLGNVQMNGLHDAARAEQAYRKAILWFGRAVAARPTDTRAKLALANAYGWLADSYFMRGQWPGSLTARLAQYRLVAREVRLDPSNMENAYRLALAQRGAARSYIKLQNIEQGAQLMHAAHLTSTRLTKHDPANAEWLLFSAFMGCELYFGKSPLPPGVSRPRLREEIRSADAKLRAQGNPRASEFSNCVDAL